MATFTRAMTQISAASLDALAQEAELLQELWPNNKNVVAFAKMVKWLDKTIMRMSETNNYTVIADPNGREDHIYLISENTLNWLSVIANEIQKDLTR